VWMHTQSNITNIVVAILCILTWCYRCWRLNNFCFQFLSLNIMCMSFSRDDQHFTSSTAPRAILWAACRVTARRLHRDICIGSSSTTRVVPFGERLVRRHA
jgi:hypothetical protein